MLPGRRPSRSMLRQLEDRYGSDKGTQGPTPEWGGHNYTDIYEGLFRSYRDEKISLLEIGLGLSEHPDGSAIATGRNRSGAASLRMWHDYFTVAAIFGIDIKPLNEAISDRISTAVADQGSRESIRRALAAFGVAAFHIIVDDGSHRAHDQQVSLEELPPALAPGGMYIIEDLDDRVTLSENRVVAVSTRALLKSFARRGAFAEPNGFMDAETVAEQIDEVSFHCPIPKTSLRDLIASKLRELGIDMPKAERRHRFFPDSEKLAVIWKR